MYALVFHFSIKRIVLYDTASNPAEPPGWEGPRAPLTPHLNDHAHCPSLHGALFVPFKAFTLLCTCCACSFSSIGHNRPHDRSWTVLFSAGTQYTDVNAGSPSKHLAEKTQKPKRMSKQGSGARCQVGERLGGGQWRTVSGRTWRPTDLC